MNDVTYEASTTPGLRRGGHRPHAGAYRDHRGRVFTVTGRDWDSVLAPEEGRKGAHRRQHGSQHPSTHGVLRLILELDGETVTEARCGIGYLHTGIEKNSSTTTWTQGVAFVTRMDYLACMANEAATSSPWKAARHRGRRPERAQIIRDRLAPGSSASPRISSRLRPAASRWARSPR